MEEEQRYLNKMLRVGRPQSGAAEATGPVPQSGLSVYINNGEQPYVYSHHQSLNKPSWTIKLWYV